MAEPTRIKVAKSSLLSDMPGRLRPFSNDYECTGPDGKQFTNTNLATLRRKLREKYGRVELEITET